MFVAEDMPLDVGFPVARAKLVMLADGQFWQRAAEEAYGTGMAAMADPDGPARPVGRLAEVRLGTQIETDEMIRLVVRWEAIGPDGTLFPALDADLTLVPDGEHRCVLGLAGVLRPPPVLAGQQAAVLALAGGYRPPGRLAAGDVHRESWHRCAPATVRGYLDRIGCVLSHPAGSAC
ncbi:MAG: hypothetical protein ACLP52_04900 [Streptosporangiaceae bacterium]